MEYKPKWVDNAKKTIIASLQKLKTKLVRPQSLTIYKTFIMLQLMAIVVSFKVERTMFLLNKKLENAKYNSALFKINIILGTSRESLYEYVNLESLRHRHSYRKLCSFYIILRYQSLKFVYAIISNIRWYTPFLDLGITSSGIPFSQYAVIEWDKLFKNLRVA